MPDAAPANVLIVDDDQGLLRLIERTLQREGLSTATASSGKDAIAWLTKNTPDLMLLDLKLQDIEGKELINHLASVGGSVPYIIITGQGDERVAVAMMKRGALDYLVKDVDFLQFVPGVVQRALDHLAKEKRLIEAEESFRESEARFRLMADHAPVLVWMSGPDKLCTWFNRPWLEFTGRSLEQELGNGWAEGVHADDLPRCLDIYGKAVDARKPFAMEYRLRRHDGEWRWVYDQGIPLCSAGEGLTGYIGSCIDITERKRAEEAVRRSEANLARAQEIAHVGGYEFDVPGPDRLHWSAETLRILGLDPTQRELSREEYLTRVVHPDDQARVREGVERAISEAARYDLEYRIVRPDGSIRHVHSVAELVLGADNQVVKLIGTLQDITERKELEREILEISEREQSRIGQDLHDGLCQHLAGIEFRLLGLKQKLEGKSNKQVAETIELARLVRQAIEQTRTLARGLSPVMLDPDGLMTALQELAINAEKAFHISCSFNCPVPVLIHDNAVATHLYRIAQEAVQNAIRHGKAKFIVINLLKQNDRIVLGVKDDGVGFPKKPRKHDGMGLRVMQYRAGMVGGSLVVQREPGRGTSVVCSLRAHRGGQETARHKDKRGDE